MVNPTHPLKKTLTGLPNMTIVHV